MPLFKMTKENLKLFLKMMTAEDISTIHFEFGDFDIPVNCIDFFG